MNILIRADASFHIGTGHIMRDLVLAQEFAQESVVFATQKLRGDCNHLIEEAGYAIEHLSSNTFGELDTLVKKLDIDLLILDHYALNYAYEKQLKAANPKLKLMVLDDTYERHYCDILLNHNIYADPKRYKRLVPKGCELRCGAKYTLLREEFLEPKKIRVLLAMGGADTLSLTSKVLKILLEYPHIRVDVITTRANTNLEKLQSCAKKQKAIKLHIETKQLASLARKSHFAIITPSVLANELYSIHVPFISIQTATNQKEMVRFLKKKHCKVLKRFNSKKLQNFIEEYLR
ncbi:MAG: UDP-2,4-diacetamido-2,4,6-trideoxy-beta-L-altropyranose hydrolase [Helicobacteraceae bacterium]|nr:UDP-2,4-diacetamido-2,4,6-trideoxy-beta-L-altropyranose hydrolase [Helicobacteraceae bacterium]